jgi:ATP-dependent Lon protease
MTTYPVLPLTDAVLLPGMVIPVTLDSATQAAIDAARTGADGRSASSRAGVDERSASSRAGVDERSASEGDGLPRVLAVPRLDGAYGPVGTIAVIEKVGRLPTGEPAAVVRGETRARIGSGVPAPGAALWVESTPFVEAEPTGRARELAREYKSLISAELQRRGAWQVIDAVERMTDPAQLADSAGYTPWLTLAQKSELLNAPDVTARLELLVAWAREHVAELEVSEKISEDVRAGLEKSQREFLLRQQLGAIRKELGEDEPDGRTSRTASWSTSPGATGAPPAGCTPSAVAARAPSSPWSDRPVWARPASASRWRAPWAAGSCGSRSAACATRPRSGVTAVRTWARCRAGSSALSARRVR